MDLPPPSFYTPARAHRSTHNSLITTIFPEPLTTAATTAPAAVAAAATAATASQNACAAPPTYPPVTAAPARPHPSAATRCVSAPVGASSAQFHAQFERTRRLLQLRGFCCSLLLLSAAVPWGVCAAYAFRRVFHSGPWKALGGGQYCVLSLCLEKKSVFSTDASLQSSQGF